MLGSFDCMSVYLRCLRFRVVGLSAFSIGVAGWGGAFSTIPPKPTPWERCGHVGTRKSVESPLPGARPTPRESTPLKEVI